MATSYSQKVAVVSYAKLVGNVSWILFPGGTELGTQVKTGESGRPHRLSINPK